MTNLELARFALGRLSAYSTRKCLCRPSAGEALYTYKYIYIKLRVIHPVVSAFIWYLTVSTCGVVETNCMKCSPAASKLLPLHLLSSVYHCFVPIHFVRNSTSTSTACSPRTVTFPTLQLPLALIVSLHTLWHERTITIIGLSFFLARYFLKPTQCPHSPSYYYYNGRGVAPSESTCRCDWPECAYYGDCCLGRGTNETQPPLYTLEEHRRLVSVI